MEPPVVPDGEVTLAGAGHHAVSLNDVEMSRRASVLAYCARLCDPASIAGAADAAFAEFRRTLETSGADAVVDLDRLLLEATRDAAAARVDAATASSGRIASRRSAAACSVMPTLLAGRASGRLSSADREGVERHLARCSRCRSLDRRREEAEQAYAALLGSPVPGAPAAAEPFAPGDPEPEVTAARPFDAPAATAVGAQENPATHPLDRDESDTDWLEAEPHAGEQEQWTEQQAMADTDERDALEIEPEPEASYEEPTAVATTSDEQPPDAVATTPASQPPASRAGGRPRSPGRMAIVAIIGAGLVFLAVGLVQILSGDDEATQDRPARPAAQSRPGTPAPAPARAADPAPTQAQLRTRARLRAMGDRELSPGTTGSDVKALQKLLGVQQTGTYGELTTYAVSQFQAEHDLPQTGIADAVTKRKLARRRRPPASAPTPPSTQTPEPPGDGSAAPPSGSGGGTPEGTAPSPAPDGSGTPPAAGGTGTTPPPATPGGTGTPGQ